MTSTLIVPSASVASGLASYIAGVAHLDLAADVHFIAEPGSDLEALLPRSHVLPAGASAQDLSRAIGRVAGGFDRVETHGPRALLAARRAHVRRESRRHVYHETPLLRSRLGLGEIALALGAPTVANSPHVARAVGRMTRSVPMVVPPVVLRPEAPMSREAARLALGLDGELALGVVGRLHERKRPKLAIDAVARLPAELRARAVVVAIGDGPLHGPLCALARERKVRLVAPGHLPGAAAYVRAFDVFVSPSPFETFGLAVAEAIMAEVAVAAVRAPGPAALLPDGPLASPSGYSLAGAIVAATQLPAASRARQAERLARTYGLDAMRPLYERHYG